MRYPGILYMRSARTLHTSFYKVKVNHVHVEVESNTTVKIEKKVGMTGWLTVGWWLMVGDYML